MSLPQRTQGQPAVDRRGIIAVSVIVAAAVIAIGVTAVLTAGGGDPSSASATGTRTAAATAEAPPPIPELGGILLDANALGSVFGPPFTLTYSQPSLWNSMATQHVYSPPECAAMMATAEARHFASLDWLGSWVKAGNDTADPPQLWVIQAVVLAPDDSAAARYLVDTAAIWKQCTVKTFTTNDPADAVWGDVVVTTPTPDRLESTVTQQGTTPWSCRHVLTAKGAYLVDAQACGVDTTKIGALVDQILGNIPT